MNDLYMTFLEEIEDLQPNYYGFEQVVYSAMDLLKERNSFDLSEASDWLKEILANYWTSEVMERINTKIDDVIRLNPEKEQEFYSQAFLLGELSQNEYNRDIDKCCEYLGELNPTDWIENYQWLEDWVKEKDLSCGLIQVPTMPNAKPYELMTILALDYVKEALSYHNKETQLMDYKRYSLFKNLNEKDFLRIRRERAVREVINAFMAINKAKEWRFQLNLQDLEEQFSKKALSNNGRAGGLKRHEKNHAMKNKVLSLWQKYKSEEEKPSKNEFAKIISASLKIPETTIRKNWLQGI